MFSSTPPAVGGALVRVLGYVSPLAFGAFIVFSAFSIALSQITLGLAMVTGLALWAVRRPRLSLPARKVLSAAALFVVWMVIASLLGDRPWESLGAIREEWLFLIIPLGLLLMDSPASTRRFVTILAATVLLIGLYGITQHFTGLYIFKNHGLHSAADEVRVSGGFSHPLTYGNYLATATLFICGYAATTFRHPGSRLPWLPLAAGICGLIAVALCNSRGPMLSAAIGLVALGLLSRKILYGFAAVGVTASIFVLVSPSVVPEFTKRVERDLNATQPASRLFIWKTAAGVALSSPLSGVGPANFGREYVKHLPPEFSGKSKQGHAHNDFLHIAAIAGMPGLLLFITLFGVVIRQLWRAWRNSSLSPPDRALAIAALVGTITFLATSMTEASFTDEEVRQLLMLIWAIGLSAWTSAEKGPAQPASEPV